jgi:hypothetical protein
MLSIPACPGYDMSKELAHVSADLTNLLTGKMKKNKD